MRHENQTPVAKLPILSYRIQRWLYENDRTALAVYSPGFTGQRDPNHRAIIGGHIANDN